MALSGNCECMARTVSEDRDVPRPRDGPRITQWQKDCALARGGERAPTEDLTRETASSAPLASVSAPVGR
jgi:hypothetical protein